MSKQYKIRTIQDIYNKIPSDRLDVFLDELKTGIVQAQFVRGMSEMIAPVVGAESHCVFPEEITWVDDGKGEVVCNVSTEIEGEEIHSASLKISPNK